VDDLLDVSRSTRGKIELRRDRFDLVQAVHAAIESNRSLIDTRRHKLRLTLPQRPIMFHGDFARSVQIVANLVHNAAKYTAAGGEIAIVAGEEAAVAVIRVRDSGIGMPKERLADIFEPFVQLPHGPDQSNGGLGVGLSLVKTLVELHGGTVEAQSPGSDRGSEFVVRLPLGHEVANQAGVNQAGADQTARARRKATRNRGSASARQDPAV
jgi:signal transduction histidine kinase